MKTVSPHSPVHTTPPVVESRGLFHPVRQLLGRMLGPLLGQQAPSTPGVDAAQQKQAWQHLQQERARLLEDMIHPELFPNVELQRPAPSKNAIMNQAAALRHELHKLQGASWNEGFPGCVQQLWPAYEQGFRDLARALNEGLRSHTLTTAEADAVVGDLRNIINQRIQEAGFATNGRTPVVNAWPGARIHEALQVRFAELVENATSFGKNGLPYHFG